ncbi:hypothetical protein OESDEN_08319, partial [Oesophagostomum dentatum]
LLFQTYHCVLEHFAFFYFRGVRAVDTLRPKFDPAIEDYSEESDKIESSVFAKNAVEGWKSLESTSCSCVLSYHSTAHWYKGIYDP